MTTILGVRKGHAILIARTVALPQDYSFFLLGVSGAGKSTLFRQCFVTQKVLVINLLDPSVEFVILDEIQKVPKLLDVVHLLLETDQSPKKFILTGSSAKKLRAAGVNLLAGRAFTYYLFPFSYLEFGEAFDLELALAFGLLPKVFFFTNNTNKIKFLQSYVANYLTEEIRAEQLVKNIEYFRRFLEVAAQANGKILNFLNIARALSSTLGVIPTPGASDYSELFDQFIVIECFKLKHYYQLEYRFSYLLTAGDAEIDLIIERPGLCPLFIEIKSRGM